MNKLIFVTGVQGSGKSTYIQRHYMDSDRYFIFDIAKESIRLFGHFGALEDEDKLLEIFNELSESAMFALLEGRDLVVEYCMKGYDEDLMRILKAIKSTGLRTELIHLSVDAGEASMREGRGDANFSSLSLNSSTLEVLEGVVESYLLNLDLEEICEIGNVGGSVKLFRKGSDGKDLYFCISEESALFEFEPEYEFEKIEGANYVKLHNHFQEAFDFLMSQQNPLYCLPLKVNPKYKKAFNKAYQKHLNERSGGSIKGTVVLQN